VYGRFSNRASNDQEYSFRIVFDLLLDEVLASHWKIGGIPMAGKNVLGGFVGEGRFLGKCGGLAFCLLALPASGFAAETTTYSYDALGRVTGAVVSGGPSNGLNNAIQYDPAGNRTNYQVTNSANNSPPVTGVIVLPLNGFTVIPLTGGI
jgi:hypothetical protein